MNILRQEFLSGSSDPQTPAELAKGLEAGKNSAFWVGVVIALVALLLGLFLRKAKSSITVNGMSARMGRPLMGGMTKTIRNERNGHERFF
jgi:hypothetical protein